MNKSNRVINTFLTLALILTFLSDAISCSMCKITKNGKTIVGNNEDFFVANSEIHFRKGLNGNYGFAFLKYNFGGFQGGMNEAGLAFDGFAVSERKPRNTFAGKPPLDSSLIVEIMQKCKSVYEVKSKFSKYDLNTINGGMHLFVDKEGNYLVIESDTLTIGNDPTYALSCFSPSSKENSNKVALDICCMSSNQSELL